MTRHSHDGAASLSDDAIRSWIDKTNELESRQQNCESKIAAALADIYHIQSSLLVELNSSLHRLVERVQELETRVQDFAHDSEIHVTSPNESLPTTLLFDGSMQQEFGCQSVPWEIAPEFDHEIANQTELNEQMQASPLEDPVFMRLHGIMLEHIRREISDCATLLIPTKSENVDIDPFICLDGQSKFEESIWDASILIGTDYLPYTTTFAFVTTLLANIGCQVTFCLVVQAQFSDTNLPANERLTYWRASAHDWSNADPITGFSLVARVCNMDGSLQVADSQAQFIQNAAQYLAPVTGFAFKTGPTIFTLSWILWAMVAFREGSTNLRLLTGLSKLPRGDNTVIAQKRNELCFECISLKRLALMALLSAVRLAVDISLFLFGTTWLVHTVDIQNLVLNAAALGFILDMPGMLFDVFMPPIVKAVIRALKPIPLPRPGKNHVLGRVLFLHIGCHTLVAATLLASVFTYTYFNEIEPIVQELETLNHTLCGGEQHFMWRMNADIGVMAAVATPAYVDRINHFTKPQRLKLKAVEDVWNLDMMDISESGAVLVDSLVEYELITTASVSELTNNAIIGSADCDSSHVHFSSLPILAKKIINTVAGNINATSCDDVAAFCGSWASSSLRMWCPTQCGCADPRSGLFHAGPARGCPRDKCISSPQYTTALLGYQCVDPSPKEFKEIRG